MKTTLVCGMLGSGKTTFIRNFLKESGEKTVVLVNDFGSLDIDGEIISAGGIETVELPSGCVCCTLRFDLITTIGKIRETYRPDHLIVEPSGIASPSGVLEALASAGAGGATVIGIMDATEFAEFHESGMCGNFFEDQIRMSDMVLVNKIDLADEAQIEKSVRIIEALNPHALIFRTRNAMINGPLPDPFSALRAEGWVKGDSSSRKTIYPQARKAHIRFETLSFRLKDVVSLETMQEFFRKLAEGNFGRVARAKALVKTDQGPYRFDLSSGRADSVVFERDVTESRMVVIGESLDESALKAMVDESAVADAG